MKPGRHARQVILTILRIVVLAEHYKQLVMDEQVCGGPLSIYWHESASVVK